MTYPQNLWQTLWISCGCSPNLSSTGGNIHRMLPYLYSLLPDMHPICQMRSVYNCKSDMQCIKVIPSLRRTSAANNPQYPQDIHKDEPDCPQWGRRNGGVLWTMFVFCGYEMSGSSSGGAARCCMKGRWWITCPRRRARRPCPAAVPQPRRR